MGSNIITWIRKHRGSSVDMTIIVTQCIHAVKVKRNCKRMNHEQWITFYSHIWSAILHVASIGSYHSNFHIFSKNFFCRICQRERERERVSSAHVKLLSHRSEFDFARQIDTKKYTNIIPSNGVRRVSQLALTRTISITHTHIAHTPCEHSK